MAWTIYDEDYRENFEGGNNGLFDADTGTVTIQHYPALASKGLTPYIGAYAAEVVMTAGSTTDHYLNEADFNLSLNDEGAIRFAVCFGRDCVASTTDEIEIMTGEASAVTQLAIAASINSDGTIQLGIGKAGGSITLGDASIVKGLWYVLDLVIILDAGGGNNGQLTLHVTEAGREGADSGAYLTTAANLDQLAVTDLRLGVQGQLSATTGTILFDDVVYDLTTATTRIGTEPRFEEHMTINADRHLFLGRGTLDMISFSSDTDADTVKLYDTDRGRITKLLVTIQANTNNFMVTHPPVNAQRGIKAVFSGTIGSADLFSYRVAKCPHYSQATQIMLGRSTV